MGTPLRQHTATTILIGPFLAATDGFTRQTALALTGTGVWLSKLDGTPALGTSTATLAGGTNGWYSHSVATSVVDTAGRFRVDYNATGSAISLAVWHEYIVYPQQVYDSINTATDLLDVSVRQWDGATVATATGTFPNVNVTAWTGQTLATATGDVPKVNLTHIGGATLATDTAQIGVNVVQWRLNTIATATGTQPNVNLTHNAGNAVTATGSMVVVDVGQWGKNAIATATGTRPQVDLRLINGATFAALDANITHIGGSTLATGVAQIGVNVVNWTGQTIATSTGTYPNVNAARVNNATPETATDIAEEVWNTDCTLYQTQGSFGQAIGDPGSDTDTIWALVNQNLDDRITDVAANVMNSTVEGSTTVVQSMRLWNGVIGGDSTGVDTGAPIYKSLGGAANRWEGTANLGNRTVSNRDLTAT